MIGMIGGIGIPENGVVYTAWNVGKVDCREPDLSYVLLCGPNQTKDQIVDAVDGLLMMTQYDLPWREDLFSDFDFYDVSQAFEFRRAGYEIVVPYQKEPWWCTTADSQSSPIMTGTGKSVWKNIRNF